MKIPSPTPRFPALTRTLTLLALSLAGCGGGGGSSAPPPELNNEVVFSRHRDVGTGLVTPVLSESGTGFDAAEVDSPSVVVDSARVDKFMLFYEASSAGGVASIGVVTSDEEDFATLTVNRTEVISPGGSGFTDGATDPAVLVDKSVPPATPGRYHMWFEGRSGGGGATSAIIHCTSDDGLTWIGFAICTGLTPSFASVRVADPTVIEDGGTFMMWFEAIDTSGAPGDGPGVIGYAESSDGDAWVVRDLSGATGNLAEPVFVAGLPGNFDGYSVNAPTVVMDPVIPFGTFGHFKMWYEAGDFATDTENTIGYTESPDGLEWSDPILPTLRPSSDLTVPLPFDSGDLEHPSVVIRDGPMVTPADVGYYLLWYTGDGEGGASGNRIGLARGRDGP